MCSVMKQGVFMALSCLIQGSSLMRSLNYILAFTKVDKPEIRNIQWNQQRENEHIKMDRAQKEVNTLERLTNGTTGQEHELKMAKHKLMNMKKLIIESTALFNKCIL